MRRLTARAPQTAPGIATGLFGAGIGGGFVHTKLGKWWCQRGLRADVNHLPILMFPVLPGSDLQSALK